MSAIFACKVLFVAHSPLHSAHVRVGHDCRPAFMPGGASRSCTSAQLCASLCTQFNPYPTAPTRLAPTCEWDTAAADIIVREAGGVVLQAGKQDNKGNPQQEWKVGAARRRRGDETQGNAFTGVSILSCGVVHRSVNI